tara:strand:+ start:119 stop:406 length:288 start_codon:yes stop_codon:yes gene_type:complete
MAMKEAEKLLALEPARGPVGADEVETNRSSSEEQPEEYIDSVRKQVREASPRLSKSEELRYYKQCAREVRLIMGGLDRMMQKQWQQVLFTLTYMK